MASSAVVETCAVPLLSLSNPSFFEAFTYAYAYLLVTSARDVIDTPILIRHHTHLPFRGHSQRYSTESVDDARKLSTFGTAHLVNFQGSPTERVSRPFHESRRSLVSSDAYGYPIRENLVSLGSLYEHSKVHKRTASDNRHECEMISANDGAQTNGVGESSSRARMTGRLTVGRLVPAQ